MQWVFIAVFGLILITGLVMMMLGVIRIWLVAFRNSILAGLACVFIPFFTWLYLILHWHEAKPAFFLWLRGLLVIAIGGFLAAWVLPRFGEMPRKEMGPAREVASATNQVVKSKSTSGSTTLRLQAIFYDPAKPSAIISGKTVFVGDKVAEWSVKAIGQHSVTLENANGQTNTLAMK